MDDRITGQELGHYWWINQEGCFLIERGQTYETQNQE